MTMYRPTRNVFLLSLVSFFNDLSSEMVLSVFPAFFVSVLKTGAGSLGFVEGLADGASNIIKIYSGRWSDKVRKRKPFILSGYSLSVATRPLYLAVTTVAGAAGLRFLDRVGKGLRDSPRDAMISLSTPKEELGRAYGFHRMFDTLGAIAGPLVAYLILRAYPNGFRAVFLTAFFAGLLAVGSLFFVTEVVGEYKKNRGAGGSIGSFSTSFKRYLLALFLLSIGSIPVAVLLLKTQSIGLTLASVPLFYLVYNLSYAVFSFPAGKMSDRVGAKGVIALGYVLLLLGYGVLALASGTAVLVVGFLVLGFFPALTDGVQRAFAAELSPEAYRGTAIGFVNGISGIGLLLAGVSGGYLWQTFGANTAFFVASFFVVLGINILWHVVPSRT